MFMDDRQESLLWYILAHPEDARLVALSMLMGEEDKLEFDSSGHLIWPKADAEEL